MHQNELTTPVGALEQSSATIQAMLPKSVRTVADYSVPTDAVEPRTLITKLKSKGPQALVLCLLPAQIKAFVEQSRALQFKADLIGENTFNDSLVTEMYKDVEHGPVFVDWYTEADFLVRLTKEGFPLSHNVETAQGYFLGQLLLSLAKKTAPSFAPKDILNELHKETSGQSPAGQYQIKNSPDFGWQVMFPAVLSRISKGKIVSVSKGR